MAHMRLEQECLTLIRSQRADGNRHAAGIPYLNQEMSDIISDLFEVRSSSDYDDFYVNSKSKVVEQYQKAEFFVKRVNKYLNSKL